MGETSSGADMFDRFLEEQRRHFTSIEAHMDRFSARVEDHGRKVAKLEVIAEEWVRQRDALASKVDALRSDLLQEISALRVGLLEKESELRRMILVEDRGVKELVDRLRADMVTRSELDKVSSEVVDLRTKMADMRGRTIVVGTIIAGLASALIAVIVDVAKKALKMP